MQLCTHGLCVAASSSARAAAHGARAAWPRAADGARHHRGLERIDTLPAAHGRAHVVLGIPRHLQRRAGVAICQRAVVSRASRHRVVCARAHTHTARPPPTHARACMRTHARYREGARARVCARALAHAHTGAHHARTPAPSHTRARVCARTRVCACVRRHTCTAPTMLLRTQSCARTDRRAHMHTHTTTHSNTHTLHL